MSSSNWINSGEMSPERSTRYQVDGVALQLGLGLPVELIGATSNVFDNRESWIADTSPQESKLEANDIKKTVDGIPVRKVYVTNINLEVERPEITSIFSFYGQIMNVFLGVSKNAPHKKFAFVTFADPEAASRVVSLHKFQDSKGRRIFVLAADSWHQPREGDDGKIIWKVDCKMKARQEEESEEEQSSAEETHLATAEITEEGLNVLNDDCLLHIFSFLPLQEIARVESVCKRWQGLSYRMWRCLHKLSFSEPTMPNMKAKTAALAAYLRRCGPSILELDLAVYRHKFDKTTLAIVAKHCHNLEVLRIARLEVGDRSLAHLGRSCPNLKQLVIVDCNKFNDKDLMSLLLRCTQLRVLDISDNENCLKGTFLSTVQSPLSSLHLRNLQALNGKALFDGLKRMSSSLEILTIHSWNNVFSGETLRIVSAVPNLISLTLSQSLSGCKFDYESLMLFGQFKKLTSLNLNTHQGVNDNVLAAIVDGCKCLTNINLSSSGGPDYGNLTEEGLAKLGTLRKLTHLDISYLDAATDTALKKLSSRNNRIQTLVCRGCPEVTDDGSVQVVTLCNDLELFDLSGCNNVGNETVSAALTSVKMRTNNVPLKLIVGGTNVSESLQNDPEVPLLTIDTVDFSEEHLRPDFVDEMFFPASDSDEDEDLDDHLSVFMADDLVALVLFLNQA